MLVGGPYLTITVVRLLFRIYHYKKRVIKEKREKPRQGEKGGGRKGK